MDIGRAFGQLLKQLREDKGLTQESLAHDCGLDRTFISLLERGLRQPSLTTIFLLAHTLEMSPSQMVAAVEKEASGWVRNKKK